MMNSLAVIYLARGADNGLASALRFLASLAAHPAGALFSLHVLMKGWDNVPDATVAAQAMAAAGARLHDLPDDGLDWGAYFRAADLVIADRLLFLNTHSEVLAPDWLRHLGRALDAADCGLVGATGSWGVKDPPLPVLWRMLKAKREHEPLPLRAGRMALHTARRVPALLKARVDGGFPNPHIRSNGFLIRRKDLLAFRARCGFPRTKDDTWEMESGVSGLTRHILATGRSAFVVGRDGQAYPPENWLESRTFRMPDRGNLLIADNQTRAYDAAQPRERRLLELAAWGRVLTT